MFFANVQYKELKEPSRRKPMSPCMLCPVPQCMQCLWCSVGSTACYTIHQAVSRHLRMLEDGWFMLVHPSENVKTRKGHSDICESIICKICNLKNVLSTSLDFGQWFLSVPYTSHLMRNTESAGARGARYVQCDMKPVGE